MAEDKKKGFTLFGGLFWIAILALGLVGYQMFSGSNLSSVKIGGEGGVVIELEGDKDEVPDDGQNTATNAKPKASSSFFAGRWAVEQKVGVMSGGSTISYLPDGSFSGHITQFIDNQGQKMMVNGEWNIEVISDQQFRLNLMTYNAAPWSGRFTILDQNRILNVEENYVAKRVD